MKSFTFLEIVKLSRSEDPHIRHLVSEYTDDIIVAALFIPIGLIAVVLFTSSLFGFFIGLLVTIALMISSISEAREKFTERYDFHTRPF